MLIGLANTLALPNTFATMVCTNVPEPMIHTDGDGVGDACDTSQHDVAVEDFHVKKDERPGGTLSSRTTS